ncbi:hypothetical protein TREES_T100009104 [Tupaia chinensis]|uniref:Uncharacterized protein n=1 Tax=Tupaia chinensis TaxID=246437 RepID=L9KMI0_TUPCH|nr:hypothetical protein TREES_T100009104 [Tupaia chinensis]
MASGNLVHCDHGSGSAYDPGVAVLLNVSAVPGRAMELCLRAEEGTNLEEEEAFISNPGFFFAAIVRIWSPASKMPLQLCFYKGINCFPRPGTARRKTSVSGSATSPMDLVNNPCDQITPGDRDQ